MKLRRWSPRGRRTATQELILSEGSRRNRTAPRGADPQTRVSSGSGCSYSRDYGHREEGWEKGPERAGLGNKMGVDWLGLVYAFRPLAGACPEGLAWQYPTVALSWRPGVA